MKKFFDRNSENREPEEMRRRVRRRKFATMVGAMAVVGGFMIAGASSEDNQDNGYGGVGAGLMMAGLTTAIFANTMKGCEPRHDDGGDGFWDKGWEPPERPEPTGPSGIDQILDWTSEVEDYLKSESLTPA